MAVVSAHQPQAQAQTLPLPGVTEARVEWVTPPGCPGTADLHAEIERLLGHPLAETTEGPLEAHGRVSLHGARWRLALELREAAGVSRNRNVEGESCRALLEAAAMVIALAVNPALEPAAAPRETVSEPRSEPDLDASRATPAASAAVPAPATAVLPTVPQRVKPALRTVARHPTESGVTPLRWGLGAFALVDGWALPRAAPGGGLRGSATLGSWQLGMLGGLFMAPEVSVRKGASARFWMGSAQLRTCYLMEAKPWATAPCLAVEADVIEGATDGVTRDMIGRAGWWTAGPGLAAVYALGQALSLEAGATLLVALRSHEFVVRGSYEEPTHQTPAATVRGHLGVDLQLQ